MRRGTVDRTVVLGAEVLSAAVHGPAADAEYVYARPVGRDAWFHCVGVRGCHSDACSLSLTDGAHRDSVDAMLLDRGYPVRARDGTTPPEGHLQVMTMAGTEDRPFHTYPRTFIVSQEQGPSPRGPPSGDDVHVVILEKLDGRLRVRVDAAGGPPPEYAIREAALSPYRHAQNRIALPQVSVEN